VRILRTLLRDQDGLETIEYAIIAGLITVMTLLVVAAIALWISNRIQTLQAAIGA
jgi:Flp pilus assembly pilin Flp